METEAADRRQFQCRPDRVDPEAEPEQVQLDPLVSRYEDTGKAIQRHLKPRSTWRDPNHPAPGKKSLPTAFDGSWIPNPGTRRAMYAMKVLLLGPGQAR